MRLSTEPEVKKKNGHLRKRIEGEIERRIIDERKLRDKITDMERKIQELEEKNKKLKGSVKKMREDLDKVTVDKNVLKWEEVGRNKTLVLKNGRNWGKEERVDKWIARHIGEVEYEVKKNG